MPSPASVSSGQPAAMRHDWVVWYKSKKGAEEIRSFVLSGKEFFSNYDETKSKEEKNKKEQKEGTLRAERTIQVVVEARQHQNGSERGSRFMLGSQRSHCHNKINLGFVDSSEGVGRKGRMSSTTHRYRAGILDGHRDRQITRLRFPKHGHSG